MTELELIKKIRELKQIQPRQDWVVLTKNRILGEQREWVLLRMLWRPAFVVPALLVVILIGGIFIASESSIPGESLHPIKKITETTQENLTPEQQKPEFYLTLAEKRIEELKQAVESNQTKNLSSAIKETTESIKKASESVLGVAQAPEQTAKLVKKVTNLKKGAEEVGKALGITIGEQEIAQLEEKVLACITASMENTKSEMTKILAERAKREIEYWKSRTLTEANQKVLEESEQLYEEGNYAQALELLLNNQQ